ncbi:MULTISPECIES: hypothetical protein [unclassified Wenzhouxiangella]|uniref:hypothetical protein n=1 Tax=unclassified Wenzhouxiangella TaxID=2613841 RepID=UPI0015F26F5C|nr:MULTISPECIES: hypothetical protein [unclassified Wenzhouxiangella]
MTIDSHITHRLNATNTRKFVDQVFWIAEFCSAFGFQPNYMARLTFNKAVLFKLQTSTINGGDSGGENARLAGERQCDDNVSHVGSIPLFLFWILSF